jgi:RNA polymerase sigma factor (TIGR02999 family)
MGELEQAAAEQTVVEALSAIDGGDRAPASRLLPLVYDLLRRRAQHLMDHERASHTLTPTALVHEAYLRVADRTAGFESRRHFYNAAAQAMRRILVEHARARGRVKRGGGAARVSLDSLDVQHPLTSDGLDWLELDEALEVLAARDQRRHQVVMLRFFAGWGRRRWRRCWAWTSGPSAATGSPPGCGSIRSCPTAGADGATAFVHLPRRNPHVRQRQWRSRYGGLG